MLHPIFEFLYKYTTRFTNYCRSKAEYSHGGLLHQNENCNNMMAVFGMTIGDNPKDIGFPPRKYNSILQPIFIRLYFLSDAMSDMFFRFTSMTGKATHLRKQKEIVNEIIDAIMKSPTKHTSALTDDIMYEQRKKHAARMKEFKTSLPKEFRELIVVKEPNNPREAKPKVSYKTKTTVSIRPHEKPVMTTTTHTVN